MAVTQKQIAEKLGVSITLVSRVLLGKAEEIGIAPATIKRVEKAAQEMGYVRNAAALTLRGKPAYTIGVVVYNFDDLFLSSLIKQIQIQAHKHGYSILLVGFLNRVPDEQDLSPLHKHAIDGLIILGSDLKAAWLNSFNHIPTARIGQGPSGEDSAKIILDEDDAAKKLMTYLAARKRKKVAILSNDHPAARMRQKALEGAAKAAGLKSVVVLSKEADYFNAGIDAATRGLQKHPDIDAFACNTYRIAAGAAHVLSERGINVSEDISVTGIGNILSTTSVDPNITTISTPVEEMVEHAFQVILAPAPSSSQLCRIPGKLIIRDA